MCERASATGRRRSAHEALDSTPHPPLAGTPRRSGLEADRLQVFVSRLRRHEAESGGASGAGMRDRPTRDGAETRREVTIMLAPLKLILLVFALVCFILAAVNIGTPKVNLVAGGLACWVASLLF
jgi:hypothetical protein